MFNARYFLVKIRPKAAQVHLKLRECFAPCGEPPPRNTAHMRQHEKIEKLEAWNRDLPAFWRDFHENQDILKNYIYFILIGFSMPRSYFYHPGSSWNAF